MKFDVIISNPPYQLSDGGNAASAIPLYNKFVEQAKKLRPRYLSMIIPARWYAGGRALTDFRSNMLNDARIRKLVDFSQSRDCFPGVEIAGGVCYFLWDREYEGACEIINRVGDVTTTSKRYLNEFPIFVRSNIGVEIINKVRASQFVSFSDGMTNYNPFLIRTNVQGEEQPFKGSLKLFSSKGVSYISPSIITKNEELIPKYKVIITYAMSGGNKASSDGNYQVVSSLKVLLPNEVCSESYLILRTFDNIDEANNLREYVKTKFFRFLLLQSLTSIHITKDSFCFIPFLGTKKIWDDQKLYSQYNLTKEEINYIESIIKPISDGGDDDAE